jgi:tetratricopeptide (TPR) repeat protein
MADRSPLAAGAPTKVFIAYDFEIGGNLPTNLARVSAKPPEGHTVKWPGDPTGLTQGAIWKTIVQREITECERLLAFVDLPNANVGFEVGYGLGLGKAVAMARVKDALPPWLSQPPLNGFLCPRLETPEEIRDEIRSRPEDWIQLHAFPTPGPGVLLLCPPRTGAAYLEEVPPEWGWQTLPKSGWDLYSLDQLLHDTGLVVWVVSPHNEGLAGRDGAENAALSVIAGYAAARPDIELRVLQAKDARVVVDVVSARTDFSTTDFARRLEDVRAEWEAKCAPPPLLVGAEADAPRRPEVEPLPRDDWSEIPDRFIGRQLQLNDVADAVMGLLHRARTGEPPSGGQAVKVVWVHGFGGMGKSWFLHRARLQAGGAVQAVIVDWDSTVWRYPLTGEPRCAAEIFETIAYRLVQTCGAAAADPYWLARDRVRDQGAAHQRLLDQFESQLVLASGPERVGTSLLRLLQEEGIWDDDLAKRTRKLETWRRDARRYQGTFAAWCRETARDADSAAIDPDRVLADGLRDSLRRAASARPLVLLLDTGEVLSAELDRWLRHLLVPLCRDESPVLVLIGSRLIPDVALPAGSREGWQAELPRDRFRPIDFGDMVRFSVEEIETALGKLKRPVDGDREEVAERLHRITRGVPLAVRALLDLHEDGAGESALDELTSDDEPLEESEVVHEVVGTVARRLLYHLSQDRKPEREDDLRDIIALAMLQRADASILQRLWPGRRVRDRLRDLGARYALLSGGDLHPTVRNYLRRYWRDEAERPAVFDDVLTAVEGAIEAIPQASTGDGSPEVIAHRTLQLNLRAWREGDRTVPELARLLTVAMAYGEGAEDVQALLRELPLAPRELSEARKLWKKSGELSHQATIAWLRGTCEGSKGWPDHEQACLALLEGLVTMKWRMTPTEASAVFTRLRAALAHFGPEKVPQREQVGTAFFRCGHAFHPEWSEGTDWLAEMEIAYASALALGSQERACLNYLGKLYQEYWGRPEDAERVYLKAIQLEPRHAGTHSNLGVLYMEGFARYAEAERALLRAIELDPNDASPRNSLGYLYVQHFERDAEAEASLRKAIELDRKYANPHNGLGWLCMDYPDRLAESESAFLRAIELEPKYSNAFYGLGQLYADHLGRHEEAERMFLKAIELDPKYANPHNNLGCLYADHLGRYDEAERAFLKAIELNPKGANAHIWLGWLYLDDLGRYDEAERVFLKVIELNPKSGSGQRALAWLCLLHLGDLARAKDYAQQAMAIEPKHPGSPLIAIAVATWEVGWGAARSQVTEWLANCPGWFPHLSRVRLGALIRKVREQGGLSELAEMLRAVEDRPHWKPWSEAVAALVAGAGREACSSDEANLAYDAITRPRAAEAGG